MLTSDLILTRMYKGEVRPRYVETEDPDLLALAEQLIDVFDTNEGCPRHELEQELKDLVGTGTGKQIGSGVRLSYRIQLPDSAGGHVLDPRLAGFGSGHDLGLHCNA